MVNESTSVFIGFSLAYRLSFTGPALIRRMNWQQGFDLVDVGHIQSRRCFQDLGQITVWIQAILLGSFNQAEVDSAGLSSAGSIGEKEVLPGHHEGFN